MLLSGFFHLFHHEWDSSMLLCVSDVYSFPLLCSSRIYYILFVHSTIKLALYIHKFHIHRISWPQIKSILKYSRKFQKAKLEFAVCHQLFEEGWASENWCFWTVELEKTLDSPLDCKEIKPVNPKGNQSWIFIGRTDTEAEASILWPPDVESWLNRKDPDAGKDWGQEEKGMTEDEMVGWHHWLNGDEFEQAPGDDEGQGSLACCSSWGCKELDATEQLNNNNQLFTYHLHCIRYYMKSRADLKCVGGCA